MTNKKLFSLSFLVFSGAFIVALWLTGLLSFVQRVSFYAQPVAQETYPVTDAIIALTGGSERVKMGLALLTNKKGKKLLISGVYPGVQARHILDSSELKPEILECCVVLGHAAEDTRGNAREARDFMKAEGFTSMQLVTAHYHMPRSLLLFRTQMPDIKIIPHPVLPENVDLAFWWKRSGTLRLLIAEYNKYLAVRFHLYGGEIV